MSKLKEGDKVVFLPNTTRGKYFKNQVFTCECNERKRLGVSVVNFKEIGGRYLVDELTKAKNHEKSS